jgi:hypothetical protein
MFRDDFEMAMETLWHESSQVVPSLMQQMAAYFNEFSPGASGTHYGSLVDALRDAGRLAETLFSSLNYENILEFEFVMRRGVQLTADFPPRDGWAAVAKLHGSCNYVPDGIEMSREAEFTSEVDFPMMKVLSNQGETREWMFSPTNGLPPAMCLYMKGKPIQVGREVIEAIRKQWSAVVADATTVVIVGVRPNPEDAHIWDAIAKTPASVCYVGDQTIFSEWAEDYRDGRPTWLLGERFDDALENIIAELT